MLREQAHSESDCREAIRRESIGESGPRRQHQSQQSGTNIISKMILSHREMRNPWRRTTTSKQQRVDLAVGRGPVLKDDASRYPRAAWTVRRITMQIVFAASESVPFAKTGGLADVVGALPKANPKAGSRSHGLSTSLCDSSPHLSGDAKVPYPVHYHPVSAQQSLRRNRGWRGARWGEVLLCRLPENYLIDKDFMETTATAMETTRNASASSAGPCWRLPRCIGVPDVFHVHDWQAALIPVLLRTVYSADPVLKKCGIGPHNSQRRIPGLVSAVDNGTTVAAVGALHLRQAGALQHFQFS